MLVFIYLTQQKVKDLTRGVRLFEPDMKIVQTNTLTLINIFKHDLKFENVCFKYTTSIPTVNKEKSWYKMVTSIRGW